MNRALLALLFAGAMMAQTTAVKLVTTSTTSVTITHAALVTAGISLPLSVEPVADGDDKPLALSKWSYSINSSGDLTVSFAPAFTGRLILMGSWLHTTTASTDFKITVGTDSGVSTLYECSDCPAHPAIRYLSSIDKVFVSEWTKYLQWPNSTSNTYNVFVYLKGNRVTYGISATVVGSAFAYGADIEWGVTSMPVGVIPLGHTTITNGVFNSSVTDDRPGGFTTTSSGTDPDSKGPGEPVIIIVNHPPGCNNNCSCSSGQTCQCNSCVCKIP